MNTLPKFAFFGTPDVARDTLERMATAGITPSLVVTNPDALAGRGRVLTPSPVKTWALAHGLPIKTPDTLDEAARAAIASHDCVFAIVVAYGKIFPEELIAQFPGGVINIHYSLLPKYRGAAPVEAALRNGDTVTGVSIQKMVHALDAGDVLAAREIAIEPTDTTRELRARLIAAGADLLTEILPAYAAGTLTGTPQDEARATYAPKIKKEDGCLTLSDNARTNWNTYRAYFESPGTYFFANRDNKRIRVKIARAAWQDDTFAIERVVPESKSEQDYAAFLQAGWQPE